MTTPCKLVVTGIPVLTLKESFPLIIFPTCSAKLRHRPTGPDRGIQMYINFAVGEGAKLIPRKPKNELGHQ